MVCIHYQPILVLLVCGNFEHLINRKIRACIFLPRLHTVATIYIRRWIGFSVKNYHIVVFKTRRNVLRRSDMIYSCMTARFIY